MTTIRKVAKGAYPDFKRGLIAMKSWLRGKEYHLSLKAMALAESVHTGKRKDGTTPEFQHQLGVTYYLRTVHNLVPHPDDTIAVGFLHDSVEDGLVTQKVIDGLGSSLVSYAVYRLNKRNKLTHRYYMDLGDDPIAALVKAADRMHNHQSMVGVFSGDKQKEYVTETVRHILPMLKKAREAFPRHYDALENARHVLKCQVDLVSRINGW